MAMDELDRTLAELRRTVVEGGTRLVVQRRAPEPEPLGDPAREPVRLEDAAREPVTPYDAARAGRTGPGQPVRHGSSGAVWPRLRLPVLLILSSILTALLLL